MIGEVMTLFLATNLGFTRLKSHTTRRLSTQILHANTITRRSNDSPSTFEQSSQCSCYVRSQKGGKSGLSGRYNAGKAVKNRL